MQANDTTTMQHPVCCRATRRLLPGLLALGLLAVVAPTIHAQGLAKVFVASTGVDTQAGTRTAPVRTFTQAQSLAAAGGEIVVLDTAGFGPLTINKSLAITVPPGVNAFITVSGDTTGISVSAGMTDVVSISGLVIEGGGASGNGAGIDFSAGALLTVENCTIRNFNVGINQDPITDTRLVVQGGNVRNTAYGILCLSSGTALQASVTDCHVDSASTAAITASANNGSVGLTASHCTLTNSAIGLYAPGGSIYAFANTISNCTNGLMANGNTAAANITSFGLNALTNNVTNGTFTTTPGTK